MARRLLWAVVMTAVWVPLPGSAMSMHVPQPSSVVLAVNKAPNEASQDTAAQVLYGAEAKEHLTKIKSRRPAAFDKASRRLEKRGFRPTDRVVVVRTTQLIGALNGTSDLLPAQSISVSAGEVVFWSWDDGDDSTWEGTMWVSRYSDGAEILQEGQIDAASASGQVYWESTVWKYLPGLEYTEEKPAERLGSPRGGTMLASLQAPSARQEVELVNSSSRIMREWIGCIINGCLVVAAGCVFSGPAYIECVVLGCAAVKAGCTLQVIISHW